MKKECVPSPPMRNRRNFARPANGRVEKLEEKLDGLYALLQTATPASSTVVSSETSVEPSVARDMRPSTASTGHGDLGTSRDSFGPETALPSSTTNKTGSRLFESISATTEIPSHMWPEPSPVEAEAYLNIFRTVYLQYLPIVVIPSTLKASRLRQEKPILWLSIMAVTSTRSSQQVALSREVREMLVQQVLEGARSMDLLLGVLIYAGWSVFTPYLLRCLQLIIAIRDRSYSTDKPIFTSLIQLAIAVLYDLGLGRPPVDDLSTSIVFAMKGTQEPTKSPEPDPLDGYRALLGCFLLSSTYV